MGVCYVIISVWERAIWRPAPGLLRRAYLYVLDGLVARHAPPKGHAGVHGKVKQEALCWHAGSSAGQQEPVAGIAKQNE